MDSIEIMWKRRPLYGRQQQRSLPKCEGYQRWSQHSYGVAIDINPLWNPYVRKNNIEPQKGKSIWIEHRTCGLIQSDDLIIRLFRDAGWKWGGWRE